MGYMKDKLRHVSVAIHARAMLLRLAADTLKQGNQVPDDVLKGVGLALSRLASDMEGISTMVDLVSNVREVTMEDVHEWAMVASLLPPDEVDKDERAVAEGILNMLKARGH